MKSEFRVRLCSDLDYEEMVADICYKNSAIAIVTQEEGLNKMEIELLPFPKEIIMKFSLNDFLETLLLAKKKLIEMQKLPEE